MIVGNSLCNQAMAGSSPLDGEIRDLSASSFFNGARVEWEHVGVDPDTTGHLHALIINGELFKLLPGTESATASLEKLSDGNVRIDVRTIRGSTAILPEFFGFPYGRRAYLDWIPSDNEDVRSYKVFQKASGDAEFSLIQTVDTIDVHRERTKGVATGTGSGTVEIGGTFTGDDTNEEFTIEISSGTFRHNLTGSWSAYKTIQQDSLFYLDYGVTLIFNNEVSDYDDGDTYTFRVGPLNYFITNELDEDTYDFKIKAVDAAGNESDYNTEDTVKIIHLPNSVSSLSASWDGTNIDLSWTLPDDNDLDAVYIYTNLNKTTQVLEDNIIESGPYWESAGTTTNLQVAPSVDGEWKFLVRTVDTQGRINDSIQLVSVDTTDIPTETALNSPENLELTLLPSGGVSLDWNYKWDFGTDLSEFRVYYGISENALQTDISNGTVYETIEVESTVGFVSYSLDIEEDLTGNGSEAFFVVRASDGTSETQNTTSTSITLDADAPTLSGSTNALPN